MYFDKKIRNNLVKNDLYSNISLSRNFFHNIQYPSIYVVLIYDISTNVFKNFVSFNLDLRRLSIYVASDVYKQNQGNSFLKKFQYLCVTI